jgi:disulfide bond formation protein DsbB
VALLVALVGSIGSVWLSVGLGLKACPLCFYQRTAVFLALGTLLLGLVANGTLTRGVAAWLTLPACVLGLGVAAFHVYLETSGALECPKGIAELGTAPMQSLALFVLLLPPVLLSAFRAIDVGVGRLGLAALLGVVFAYASIKSAPPLPPVPKAAYADALVICRPPFKAP